MIKVIVSDLDGTLLDCDHRLNHKTAETIRKACASGLRFIIATGRNFEGTMHALAGEEIVCDYIVSSGAELRNSEKKILFSNFMRTEDCERAYEIAKKYNISYVFCANGDDYCIGDEEEMERNMIEHIHTFNQSIPMDKLKESETYQNLIKKTKLVPDFKELERREVKITKVFAFSSDLEMLGRIKQEFRKIPELAVSSSFYNNLEITDVRAQKGPVLKEYIESLGYTMDEVMVFGDSLNDYSMLSMDFGATIAMENADPEVKKVCKYITRSNEEDGVAYVIEELLKRRQGY